MDPHLITEPKEWHSMRWTMAEDDIKIKQAMEGEDYIAGFETSKTGVAHYHIIMVGKIGSSRRVQIKRVIGQSTKTWSKANHGKFLTGVAYTIKCHNTIVAGPVMSYFVEKAPPWQAHQSTEISTTKRWLLTERNLVQIMVQHAQETNQEEASFRRVLASLYASSPWRCGESLRRGIDPQLIKEYDLSVSGQFRPDNIESMIEQLETRGAYRYSIR